MGRGSGVTIYVSNNGSSVLVTGYVRRLGGRDSVPFSLVFLIVSPNCGTRGHGLVRRGTGLLGVPIAVFRDSVFSIAREINNSPYCLYTHVQHNTLCDGTRSLKYGGVTLNRRFSSMVRAILVDVYCSDRVGAVLPGLRDAGFSKVRLVEPLCHIGRSSVVS